MIKAGISELKEKQKEPICLSISSVSALIAEQVPSIKFSSFLEC